MCLCASPFPDGRRLESIVRAANPQLQIEGPHAPSAGRWQFLTLGIHHILTGPDHLLFVLGLLMMARGGWMLLKTISGFTLAHSLTLAIATVWRLDLPVAMLNMFVALSIVFLALELMRARNGGTSLSLRRPMIPAFYFGLLHGLAFATGLSSLDLRGSALLGALLQFNVGVELGQLAFVAVILALLRALRGMKIQWPSAAMLTPHLPDWYCRCCLDVSMWCCRTGGSVMVGRRWVISILLASSIGAAFAADGPTVAAAQRRAFFGQLHIHTQSSYDAWAMGTKITAAQAYAYARGETVMVPATQLQLQQGMAVEGLVPAKRASALDFMAVTDHAENIGVMASLDAPGSAFAQTPLGQRLLKQPAYAQFARVAAEMGIDPPLPAAWNNPQVVADAWEVEKKAARDYNQPGIFTTFVAFEWTAMPGKKNLHRNVIFAGADAPAPFGANQSTKPEDLWTYLEHIRAQGEDVIAIPHNGNASGGLMYDWNTSEGRPIDEAYAQRRARNEPLSEVIQIKGQSETHPQISPNDEFANFEIYDHLLPSLTTKSDPNGSYIRQAYGRGLVIQSRVGVNPFKFGLVGGSDIHNGLENSDEAAMAGGDVGGIDPRTMTPRRRSGKRNDRVGETSHVLGSDRRNAAGDGAQCQKAAGQIRRRTARGKAQRGGNGLRRIDRRLGRREHARVVVRGAEAQGDVCDLRTAHPLAHVRRMEFSGGPFAPERSG